MPRTRSQVQRQKTANVSSQRGHLAQLRVQLLAFLDACDKDVVRVDDERSICRIKNVTAKRITKPLLQEVVEVVISQLTTIHQDPTMLSAFATQVLRESVDIVSWKGNVVENTTHEAKRQKRDDTEVRHGGTELLDGPILAIVEEYWAAIGESRTTQEEALREETLHIESPAISTPPLPPLLATIAKAGVPMSPTRPLPPLPLQPKVIREPKPKSSVSKKEANVILSRIAAYIAVEGCDESDLLTASLSILDRHWPTR